METAIREKRRLQNGVELPIECYNIRAAMTHDNNVRSPHYHEHIELLYALEPCDITVWVAGKEIRFSSGDLIVINPEVAHTFFNRLPINHYICIKAMPDLLYLSDNSAFDGKYIMPFVKGDVEYQHFGKDETENSPLHEAFARVVDEWTEKKYGFEISLKKHILDIFLWMIRHNYSKGVYLDEPEVGNSFENIRLIRKAAEYVNTNFASATEAEAAHLTNMSYSHFSRLFKRVMGCSFKDHLMKVRINASEQMLLETDLSITDVAYTCGFSTSSHFIDKFKRARGMTPRQYRTKWLNR